VFFWQGICFIAKSRTTHDIQGATMELQKLFGDTSNSFSLGELATAPQNEVVNLQMVLATSSMKHEYARKAYDRTKSFARRQELLAHMNELKSVYFDARSKLSTAQPDRLEAIESELHYQKRVVLSEYGLH
jgi:hypothetical protein